MEDSLRLWPGTQLQSPEGRLVQRVLQYEQNSSNTSPGISPHPKQAPLHWQRRISVFSASQQGWQAEGLASQMLVPYSSLLLRNPELFTLLLHPHPQEL